MTTVSRYLAWLTDQVGEQERPRGSNRQPYAKLAGHANGEPWCATFEVAGARATGLRLPDGADTASCKANEAAFKRAGRLSTKPSVGAFAFVYFPSLDRVAHTGVVWKVAGDRVHLVEGNSNDEGSREGYEVCLRVRPTTRPIGAVGIRSYGRPYYDEEEDMELTKDNLRDIADAVLSAPVTLTEAAARAIGGDTKAGDVVSMKYLLQWPPISQREGRADADRDARMQKAIDDLTVTVGRLGRVSGGPGYSLDELATAVADKLAARLRS